MILRLSRNPNTSKRIQAQRNRKLAGLGVRVACGTSATSGRHREIRDRGSENDLRRLRGSRSAGILPAFLNFIVCGKRARAAVLLAVTGVAVLAYSLPRVRAQNSSTSNPVGAGAMSAANAPIVVAQGVSVRALALGVGASESAAAAEENSGRPDIYFTAAQMSNRVMAIPASAAASANLVAVAGNGAAGSLGDGGAATAAQLSLKSDSPYMRSGVAVAPDGTVFIADTKNSTIRRIASASSSEPGIIRSVAGKWGPAEDVHLSEPMGLALDRAGNLYIADRNANAIFELHDATASTPGRLEIVAQVAQAAMVAASSDGSRVFVAAPDSGTVLRLDAVSHGMTTLVAGSGTSLSCLSAAAGRAPTGGAQAGAQNLCPDGLAVDGGGNLFIGDSAGGRIARIDAATQKLTTAASNISMPGDVAFDSDGNLFVAEQGRNRIVEIKGLGQQMANVMLTTPPAPVPPPGVPCPVIAPPPGFAANTNFCAEPLSGTTPTATFTLTNNTNAALTSVAISTIGLAPSDFVVSSTSCTAMLSAKSSCLINLGFAPTATGTRTATLVVTYMGAANPLASAVAGTGDDYQLALASGQLMQISVNAGSTGTFMLQVVPDNIFTGTVTFVCPGNLPMQTTCTFMPASVTVTTPGTAVPFSVAFQTTSRTGTPPPTAMGMPVAPAGGSGTSANTSARAVGVFIVLVVVGLLACGGRRWRVKFVHAACAILLAIGVAAILEGCHNGSSTKQIIGTPAGSYKMTVQATSQSAPRGITVTLDVQ
jgi:sugar lactone lactonase YvrE